MRYFIIDCHTSDVAAIERCQPQCLFVSMILHFSIPGVWFTEKSGPLLWFSRRQRTAGRSHHHVCLPEEREARNINGPIITNYRIWRWLINFLWTKLHDWQLTWILWIILVITIQKYQIIEKHWKISVIIVMITGDVEKIRQPEKERLQLGQ